MSDIAFINWLYHYNYGGVESRVERICAEVSADLRTEMIYAAPLIGGAGIENRPFKQTRIRLPFDPYRGIWKSKHGWEHHFLSRATAVLRRSRPTLVDAQGIGALAALDADLPVVTTVRGGEVWLERDRHAPRILRDSRLVIAANQQTYRALLARGFEPDRLEQLYAGVETAAIDAAQPLSVVEREAFGLPADAKIVLSVHNFAPKKNAINVAAAFSKLKLHDRGYVLVFAGDGPGEERAKTVAYCRDNAVAGVHFVGKVDQSQVYRLLRSSDLFLLPSLQGEGWGMVFLEAMAAGVPTICSSLCGILEAMEDGADLVAVPEPERADSVAETLQAVVEDADLRARLAIRGRESSRAFDWPAQARKYLDFLARRNLLPS